MRRLETSFGSVQKTRKSNHCHNYREYDWSFVLFNLITCASEDIIRMFVCKLAGNKKRWIFRWIFSASVSTVCNLALPSNKQERKGKVSSVSTQQYYLQCTKVLWRLAEAFSCSNFIYIHLTLSCRSLFYSWVYKPNFDRCNFELLFTIFLFLFEQRHVKA